MTDPARIEGIYPKGSGASATPSGYHPAGQAPAGLGASRFDPSRLDGMCARLFAALDGEWRSLRELRLHPNTRMLILPAQYLQRVGLIESKLGGNYNLVYRRKGSA